MLHSSINSSPSCTQCKNCIIAQQTPLAAAARFSYIALLLLVLLLLRASYPMLSATNKAQFAGSGQSPCSQLNPAIDGLFGREQTARIPHKTAWLCVISSRNWPELSVCRMAFLVANLCIQRGQGIILPYRYHFAGLWKQNSGGKRPNEKKYSSEVPCETPSCWPRKLWKFARSGQETIEKISKTIAGSKRAWTLGWFPFVLLKVETKEVVDWRQWKRAAISNAPPRGTKENSPRFQCNGMGIKRQNGRKHHLVTMHAIQIYSIWPGYNRKH